MFISCVGYEITHAHPATIIRGNAATIIRGNAYCRKHVCGVYNFNNSWTYVAVVIAILFPLYCNR